MGNIVAITDPIDGEKTYAYDPQGQMAQETIGDKTYTYTYDGVGNILSATKDGVAHTYTYGDDDWGDLLTAYDGNAITYDAIGNPLTYYNGQSWNFTWVNGRTLSQAVSGDTTVSYVYDKTNGLRLSKTVGDTTYEYYYGDSQLLRMTVSDGTVMDFFYDHNGLPYAVKYNGTNYYYILNQQGDVVRLVSAEGETVGTYQYDAWGNILSATDNDLTNANPLRYRGYVYDSETGFYYLTSRYYDPKIGRFVNVDEVIASVGGDVLGYNMFAYCFNNPANMNDSFGSWPSWSDIKSGLKKVWNGVKSFVSNTFGAGVVQAQSYKTIDVDTVIYGYEDGVSTSKVICGDISKSVSVYAENASEWWKTSEYKAGVQINTKNGGLSYSKNCFETSLTFASGNTSLEFVLGYNKVGYTYKTGVSFKNKSADYYCHEYIRTLPTAAVVVGTVATCYYAGGMAAAYLISIFGAGVGCVT